MNLRRLLFIGLLVFLVASSFAAELIINSNAGDPEPKRVT